MAEVSKKAQFTEELKYSLDIMHNQVSYAETKNASLIALSGALLIGLLSSIDDIKVLIIIESCPNLPEFNETIFKCSVIIAIIFLLASMFCSLLSFMPIVTQKLTEDRPLNKTNLLFFLPNTKFNCSKALREFYSNKYKKVETFQEDIANQILNLSRIANRKYVFFKWSLRFLMIMPLFEIVAGLFLYFLTR